MQCPYCDAKLDDVSLLTNVCSSCHEVLGDINQTMRTIRLDHQAPITEIELKSQGHSAKTIITNSAPSETVSNCNPPEEDNCAQIILNRRRFSEDSESPADYEILNKIGEGGMGIIQEAKQNALNRIVAIKLLGNYKGSDAVSHFTREAAVTGNLEHPNIVPIYDLGKNEDEKPFYAMKRVHGKSWAKSLEEKSLPENIDILIHVCDAVAYAHSKGIIHRDIKPENVMLGEFGEVLLMDWGLAAGMWDGAPAPRVRYEDAIAGTPAYMAPEMARGEEDVIGFYSDIYLLGAVLFEIITGEQPHSGASIRDCLDNAAANRISDAWVSSPLLNTAKKAMADRPEDRFANVREFQAAVRTHAASTAAATRARQARSKALKSGKYFDFFQAFGCFMESLEIWEDNEDARKSLDNLAKEFAEVALKNGDLHLAQSLLNKDNVSHTMLLQRIAELKDKRS